MFDLPIDPQITLEDTHGLPPGAAGLGRAHQRDQYSAQAFSAVKGGRLAMAAPEAMKVSLLLPDVPLRTLDALSSGPTSPDHSTVEDVRDLITKYDLPGEISGAGAGTFSSAPISPSRRGTRAGGLRSCPRCRGAAAITAAATMSGEDEAFRDSVFEILLSSHDLVENARLAREAGYFTVVDNSCDDWDYADAAKYLLERFHELRRAHERVCLISVGEVTVTMDRTPGAGGRNQQFVLACARDLEKYPSEHLTMLSAGSDGIDGNTLSAGAIADPTTVARGAIVRLRPRGVTGRV